MVDTTYTSYLNEDTLPYPFCPGCGHGGILDRLNDALVKLQIDPRKVVIVSDIGCSGLSDKFFAANAFHGLHGRSVTYATGIKLANPDLTVIVLMGDGGCGIGGHHLINAARRNIGVAVMVFNNLNYGMTGGEHSVSTPTGANTVISGHGHLERPMNICQTVAVNGASFVARTTSSDKDLDDLMVEAIQNEGFSLIDIWEPCTAWYVKFNKSQKEFLPTKRAIADLGYQTGVVHREARDEYSRAYRTATAPQRSQPTLAGRPLEPKYESQVNTQRHCIIAGAAGAKVRSAGAAFSRGAALSGLWATQRHNNPITVQSGYSVSEVILSPEEILFTGISQPDIMVVLSSEGLNQEQARIASLTQEAALYINADLLPLETAARIIPLDFGNTNKKKTHWAMMALAEVLRHSQLYPLEAFREAVSLRPEFAQENLAAIEAAEGLIQDI